MPVAYLWTRTVTCKNPHCRATVPLLRQTWFCKKQGRYVALKIVAPKGKKQVRFEVVEVRSEKGLPFDPEVGSKGGNATCPFCGTVADRNYVKAESCAGHMATQLTAIVCTRPGEQGKVYLADEVPDAEPEEKAIQRRIGKLCERTGLTVPSEPIEANPRSKRISLARLALSSVIQQDFPGYLAVLFPSCSHIFGVNPSVETIRDGHTCRSMDFPSQIISSPSESASAGEAEASSAGGPRNSPAGDSSKPMVRGGGLRAVPRQ
jgi:hypothetical protein